MLLVVNAGSSSLKLALYDLPLRDEPTLTASIGRLDAGGGQWECETRVSLPAPPADTVTGHDQALGLFLGWLEEQGRWQDVQAVGHRLVHGGDRFQAPVRIDEPVLAALRELAPLAPRHLPQALACIDTVRVQRADLPQVACFDTAFHHTMPRLARLVPLPRAFTDGRLRRYGFHGISYAYILQELAGRDADFRDKRTIIAHLGNGASMVAVRNGQSVDTTMGMTPAGGLMMGTRTGDLDPGTLLWLMQDQQIDATAADRLVNAESGLLGVSGISGDVRDLQAANDPHAQEALDLFCYLAKKQLGGLLAVLGGLDRLIFTGGIGEHNAAIRATICAGLDGLGIAVDPDRNATHGPRISPDASPVEILVIPTNEDLLIARHTQDVLGRIPAHVSPKGTAS